MSIESEIKKTNKLLRAVLLFLVKEKISKDKTFKEIMGDSDLEEFISTL